VSPWVALNTPMNITDPDFHVNSSSNMPPWTPTNLLQKKTNGTILPVGGTTSEATVSCSGIVSDPNSGGLLQVQVEWKAIGSSFSGTPSVTGNPVSNGSLAVVTLAGLIDGQSYHWQARTIDANGETSPWTSFGGNAESDPDLKKVPNSPPASPTELEQVLPDGTPIPIGGQVDSPSLILRAKLADPDGDSVRLQIELRSVALPLAGEPTSTSPPSASLTTVQIEVAALAVATSYRWQARTIDSSGATSAWIPFGGNPDTAADFTTAPAAVGGEQQQGNSDSSDHGGCIGRLAGQEATHLPWGLLLLLGCLLPLYRRKGRHSA